MVIFLSIICAVDVAHQKQKLCMRRSSSQQVQLTVKRLYTKYPGSWNQKGLLVGKLYCQRSFVQGWWKLTMLFKWVGSFRSLCYLFNLHR